MKCSLVVRVREKLGLTQEQLAGKLGLHYHQVVRMESGETRLKEWLVVELKHLGRLSWSEVGRLLEQDWPEERREYERPYEVEEVTAGSAGRPANSMQLNAKVLEEIFKGRYGSVAAAGRELGIAERTIRRWVASGSVPVPRYLEIKGKMELTRNELMSLQKK
jgi:transcriptional regulator with XRE-family HTH domain